jgi:predicted membrane protein
MEAGFFWGLFLVLVGLVLLAKYVLHIDFPLLKILVGLFFVLLGLKILFGKSFFTEINNRDVLFSERYFKPEEIEKREYNVIFGKAEMDLSRLEVELSPAKLKVSTVFGSTVIYLPKDLPVAIYNDAVFSNAKLPGGNSSIFGRTSFKTPGLETGTPYLELKLDVVFGSVSVMVRE